VVVNQNGAALWPISGGGEPKPLKLDPDKQENVIGFAADGNHVFIVEFRHRPLRVSRMEIASGKRELLKELQPPDINGVTSMGPVQITPDGKYYAYGYDRILAEMYLIEGLK